MRNKVAAVLASAACSLVPSLGFAGDGPRVLVIGVDGLKPDCIPPANTPAIDRLIADGCYNDDAQAEDLTFSGPNWASILHGVHRDKHGVTNNEYRPSRLRNYPDFLTYLERDNPDLVTAKVVAWDPIGIHQPSQCDVTEIPEHNDEGVTEVAVKMLSGTWEGMPEGPDALFLHLDEVDGAGHTYGFDTSQPDYLKGIESADALIGRITDAMRARPNYHEENWLVVLVSDHGGSIDKGHSGNTPEKRTMPFLVSGEAATKGKHFPQPRTCDVAATVLTHMGTEIRESWNLDSVPIGLERTSRPVARLGTNLIYNGDAEAQRGFRDRAVDAYALGWNDPGPSQWTIVRAGVIGSIDGLDGNVFAAGGAQTAAMSQTIDLRPLATEIEEGVSFEAAANLGIEAITPTPPSVTVEFVDQRGNPIWSHTESIAKRSSTEENVIEAIRFGGLVPREARAVIYTLTAERTSEGMIPAIADDLRLVLRARN